MTTLTASSTRRHPVDVVVERLGSTDRVLGAAGALLLGSFYVSTAIEVNAIGLAGLATFVAAMLAVAHYHSRAGEDLDTVHDLQSQYADGAIDLDTFEREVELVLDERMSEVRRVVEDVGGVGEATSANVALRFRTVEAVRSADAEDLQRVNGVGPSRAAAIVERLGGERR